MVSGIDIRPNYIHSVPAAVVLISISAYDSCNSRILIGSKDGELLKNVHKRCPFCCACTKHPQHGSYLGQVATVSTTFVAAIFPKTWFSKESRN